MVWTSEKGDGGCAEEGGEIRVGDSCQLEGLGKNGVNVCVGG